MGVERRRLGLRRRFHERVLGTFPNPFGRGCGEHLLVLAVLRASLFHCVGLPIPSQ